VAENSRWKTLLEIRRTIADSLFEIEAYAEPDQNLAVLYNRIHAKYLGADMHTAAVWAYNPMYGSDPIYLQSYVVGDMIAHQISHTIDQKFGARWGTEAGVYLEQHFYTRGAEHTMEELVQSGTGEPLTVRYLVDYLCADEHVHSHSSDGQMDRASKTTKGSLGRFSLNGGLR